MSRWFYFDPMPWVAISGTGWTNHRHVSSEHSIQFKHHIVVASMTYFTYTSQFIIIIIIYLLIAKVVWAPKMILQPVSSICPWSPLPSGTWWTPGLSIPLCCLSTSSSVFLVFFWSPVNVPCKIVLGRPDEWKTCPYHCSLRLFKMVRSLCGLIACWILARTSSLLKS